MTEPHRAARRRRPWLQLVFPSTSAAIMAGSIGELTALVRLARGLPRRRFRVSFVEFLRSVDPHPRVDGLFRSLDGFALLEMQRGPGGAEVRQRRLAEPPDAVVLSSFRAFFERPQFPRLVESRLESWRREGVRVIALDPCGDSFLSPIPPDVSVLVPQPFTYGQPAREGQILVSGSAGRVPRRRSGHRWLWAAAPWMRWHRRFQAAERLAFWGLSRLGVEVSVLSPLDPALPFLSQPRLIDDGLDYTDLEAEVARHDLLLAANCRSVLAARAAAMGVPLALLDPRRLPAPGGHDAAIDDLLRAAAGEEPLPALVPLEWRDVASGGADLTADSFHALHRDLAAMRERQLARCAEYAELPTARAWLQQLLLG